MIKLFGIIKVLVVIVLDFLAIYYLFNDMTIAFAVAGVISIYVWFGGYLCLFKEGAISSKKLPSYEAGCLERAKTQLIKDVKNISGVNVSNLKVYLVPGNDDMNATAYGANCISVTKGTLNNTDPVTLISVLSHEICHNLNCDSEFNRAIFASVTLIVCSFSVLSAVTMMFIFAIFLLLNFFGSWFGVVAFKGTTKVTKGIFSLIQRAIVVFYRSVFSFVRRRAEYRCDNYACKLGYGIQLSRFLAVLAPYDRRQLTLSEAIYRTHPPCEKRIARIENFINS